jgi:AmiR/NasT family two-component response regulator
VHGEPSRLRPEVLQRSAFARLLAQLETMSVIEQAKGIVMAQSRCSDAEAFDLLRRASQRSNMPVRELAARLVANTAGSPDHKAG